MADEAPTSQNLAPNVDEAPASVDATIDSTGGGGTMSSCNNNNVAETSGLTSDGEMDKSLEYADELMERGSKANKEQDYSEATDCFSRALEIRVAHYGELAPECVRSYYKYGCALLYKAQEEADPLVSGAVAKKDVGSEHDSEKGSAKGAESVETSVSSNAKEGTSNIQEVPEDGGGEEDQEEDDDGSDADDAGADEDESDLDLAWKMLDVARAIAEKQAGDSMEKVDILSSLAEVALEREDVETSLSDYLKALSMLERLAEPDSQIGSKGQEAIPYCEKAISVCKSRLQRLTSEIESSSMVSANPEAAVLGRQASNASQTTNHVSDKEKEIEILTDLQQIVSNPSSILSDILGMIAAKEKGGQTSAAAGLSSSRLETANSSGFESPTVSTAHTNGGSSAVTHLGVVGRGVKRVSMSSAATESNPAKKPATDPSADNGGSGNGNGNAA
ncbi:Tetratricopeptide-like helical [Cynara cardunculus var. scolymus]|uniref:Tetratricopeptide-like helical n=1 Tax=Cynara cardunculus var. scolymus TaxID=59895 RepID=A0A118JV63_CYNCS|nr:Tetratricopeptide-like helical [Cynara cardunculus var. scolymus]